MSNQRLSELAREMAWPSLGILANSMVTVNATMLVAKHRGVFKIKPPSCEATDEMSESDKQKWSRIWRAQCNQFEWFSLTTPLFVISAFSFYAALCDVKDGQYAKYGPRLVGVLGLLYAHFRQEYVNGYVEDASKRGDPFHKSTHIVKTLFYGAIATTAYLVGKSVYNEVKQLKK